jgi:hypothetical protein
VLEATVHDFVRHNTLTLTVVYSVSEFGVVEHADPIHCHGGYLTTKQIISFHQAQLHGKETKEPVADQQIGSGTDDFIPCRPILYLSSGSNHFLLLLKQMLLTRL